MAHEINNLVQGLSSAAYLLEDCAKQGDPVEESFVAELQAVVLELVSMARHTNEFARANESARSNQHPSESLDLAELIGSANDFLSRVGKLKTVALTLAIPDGMPELHWRKYELEYLVLALLCHAADASKLGDREKGVRLEVSESKGIVTLAVFDSIASEDGSDADNLSSEMSDAKIVASARGGSVSFKPGSKGGVLRVTLPLRAKEAPE